ncbi:MAG: hypothetical protein JW726_14100 [Anaerolineales bacterium]|nr:hypothetical protein [Anaerolineales bacterium]
MATIKKTSIHLIRLALVFIAMSIAYIISTISFTQAETNMTPEEASWAGLALFLVSAINALVLAYPILLSHWYGIRLVSAVIIVQFGVETFMTQIETLFFNSAIQMSATELVGLVTSGLIRAVIFAPLAVLLLGRMKKERLPEEKIIGFKHPKWWIIFASLAVLYVVIYFMFGYFVAWQWEETRLFYSGTSDIKPFVTHFADLFRTNPGILPFQLLRGVLWTALATLIAEMMKAERWKVALAVALIFAGLLSSGIGLFPNPYMPPAVRQSHFFEILLSMLAFGSIAGWVIYGREKRNTI